MIKTLYIVCQNKYADKFKKDGYLKKELLGSNKVNSVLKLTYKNKVPKSQFKCISLLTESKDKKDLDYLQALMIEVANGNEEAFRQYNEITKKEDTFKDKFLS